MSKALVIHIVYAVQWRKPFSPTWTLDGIFKSRRLALAHVEAVGGGDEGYDFKVEEYVL